MLKETVPNMNQIIELLDDRLITRNEIMEILKQNNQIYSVNDIFSTNEWLISKKFFFRCFIFSNYIHLHTIPFHYTKCEIETSSIGNVSSIYSNVKQLNVSSKMNDYLPFSHFTHILRPFPNIHQLNLINISFDFSKCSLPLSQLCHLSLKPLNQTNQFIFLMVSHIIHLSVTCQELIDLTNLCGLTVLKQIIELDIIIGHRDNIYKIDNIQQLSFTFPLVKYLKLKITKVYDEWFIMDILYFFKKLQYLDIKRNDNRNLSFEQTKPNKKNKRWLTNFKIWLNMNTILTERKQFQANYNGKRIQIWC
ncbi:unnamed protein product [Didymodactylos carnosus]|uniref:Uncharacterized protein n=1 Tax=Didymodactylos carnosus TaxID=1234261 RepID=A0A815F817_9BILA|nr:unnamed protein product [Didymodactylos carnosus]CAF4170127.1 unnamed protein product [Didymodactylos carnosus]